MFRSSAPEGVDRSSLYTHTAAMPDPHATFRSDSMNTSAAVGSINLAAVWCRAPIGELRTDLDRTVKASIELRPTIVDMAGELLCTRTRLRDCRAAGVKNWGRKNHQYLSCCVLRCSQLQHPTAPVRLLADDFLFNSSGYCFRIVR